MARTLADEAAQHAAIHTLQTAHACSSPLTRHEHEDGPMLPDLINVRHNSLHQIQVQALLVQPRQIAPHAQAVAAVAIWVVIGVQRA